MQRADQSPYYLQLSFAKTWVSPAAAAPWSSESKPPETDPRPRPLAQAFPNAQGFKRGTKVEPIVYRHPAENLRSGKQPGDSGAPTFAEAAAAAAAAPVEGGRTDKDATTDELPAAHAGHDGAPSFADAVKATEGGGLKKRK